MRRTVKISGLVRTWSNMSKCNNLLITRYAIMVNFVAQSRDHPLLDPLATGLVSHLAILKEKRMIASTFLISRINGTREIHRGDIHFTSSMDPQISMVSLIVPITPLMSNIAIDHHTKMVTRHITRE